MERKGYYITFSYANNLPTITKLGSNCEIIVRLNLEKIESTKCARLMLNGDHYCLTPMTYPAFITIGHELIHARHLMERWEQLDSEFPPIKNGQEQSWWQRLKDCKTDVKYTAIDGFKNLAMPDVENASKPSREEALLSRETMFRVPAIREFEQRFGFSTLIVEDQAKGWAKQFWNNNQEEESLTIMGDDRFNDCLLLEQARELDMLKGYEGFETNGSIFRWGHTLYAGAIQLKKDALCLDDNEFDTTVDVFHETLPEDLRRDLNP